MFCGKISLMMKKVEMSRAILLRERISISTGLEREREVFGVLICEGMI